MQENDIGSHYYQQDYYDSQLAVGKNPYGEGSMQDELQEIRKGFVVKHVFPGCTFIDIGAGLGESCVVAANNFAKTYAIDVSRQALTRIPNSENDLHRIEADGMNLSLPNETADVVSLFSILEHANNPQKLLSETHRILKPNGILLLSTPNTNCLNRKVKFIALSLLGRNEKSENITSRSDHFQEFSYVETIDMLEQSDFDVKSWHGYGLIFPPAWQLQQIRILKPLIKLHVYSGEIARSLAQETYIVARCKK